MAGSSQYRSPLVYLGPYSTEPNLDDNTQRKRLVFIRRNFEPKETNGVVIYSAILEAGRFLPGGIDYTWLPWMASYDGDDRIELMREECQRGLNKPAKFNQFSVILSSILFIARVDADGTYSLRKYFTNVHQRQAGVHLFLNRKGLLMTQSTAIVPYPKMGKNDRRVKYQCFRAITQAIYPVIRHEWQSTGDDILVYGLEFGQSSNVQTGNNSSGRYYHRFSDYCLKVYGVNELTKEDILKFKQRIGNKPFTAFYVCAGAKLVVIDTYSSEQISGQNENHNRTLVQQGGVVFYEGVINIKLPIRTFDHNQDPMYRIFNWQDFSQMHLIPVSNKMTGTAYGKMTQMVVFLGGIDSDRNSIAWEFTIEDQNRSRVADLGIPLHTNRNTLIEAISEGSSGLDEIIARMGYEQLHDSVLTEHGTDFISVQDCQMLKTILNINGERSIDVDCRLHLSNDEWNVLIDKQLPREFNLSDTSSTYIEGAVDALFKSQEKRKTRAAPPPMYPPNKTDNQIIFWPSSEVPIANVETQCYKYTKYNQHEKLSIEIEYGDPVVLRKYDYDRTPDVKGYHYIRLTGETDQTYQDHSGVYHVSAEISYRIGVDGWMWQRVVSVGNNGQPIGLYHEKNVYLKCNHPTTNVPSLT